ncbi:MAG: hypothetical protein AB8B87_17750 [Granulosicoccus sp.]
MNRNTARAQLRELTCSLNFKELARMVLLKMVKLNDSDICSPGARLPSVV